MSEEEIDKHILKKYDIQQKLGKGVSALPAGRRGAGSPHVYVCAPSRGWEAERPPAAPRTGVRRGLEGHRPEDARSSGAEKDL